MSLQTLLESANPYHSVQSDAARLAEKWEKTGLLEGLNGSTKNNMGIIRPKRQFRNFKFAHVQPHTLLWTF